MLLTNTAKKILENVWSLACCDYSCCDCCHEETHPPVKKITKSDIQHSFRDSISRLDSTSSTNESTTPKSVRERSESDSVSRTDSVSSATSASQFSFEYRKPTTTPIIDMKPIEFWAANKEAIQPKQGRRRLPSETEITIENFQKDLYESEKINRETCLTDEEKLSKYQLGQIHFGLQYEVSTNILVVKIIEAKELPPPYCLDENKQDMAHSNPYCRVSLIPDSKNSHQTSVQRKTQEPTWNEYFMFEIPFKETGERTLEILVKDFDKFSRHCNIGQVHFPLEGLNLVKGIHTWKPLSPCVTDRHDLGELLLSLNYLPSAGRLNIDVIKAKQLLQTDIIGGSDPFVKITLVHFEKPVKTKKTTFKKNTLDPVFNESISFNITPQQLDTTSLVITIWDYNSKSKDDFVGRIVLGKYATGPHESSHWTRMLQSHRVAVAQWHSMRTRQECDQVSPASIAVP
ncbi:synaptotagmin-17-like [Ruditapes philippinarum]|uniref:synaptotagmin-17-like n=1 Tax=Ruditapes philippinarum TaxID=129788 RepID=UPI00295BAE60|nr:synaptotagmin-17-like [Ruditapes philippinarum]